MHLLSPCFDSLVTAHDLIYLSIITRAKVAMVMCSFSEHNERLQFKIKCHCTLRFVQTDLFYLKKVLYCMVDCYF